MREWDPRRLTSAVRAPRSFVVAALAAFLLVTAVTAARHEMWRDEADAWLYARDGDFGHLVNWTRHAGTPALWYVVLRPLARSGAPVEAQQVLHLVVIGAAIAIFLAFAPFTRLTKLLTIFSYYFVYEYAVVVRSYALAVLLIAIAAALHARRAERPVTYAIVLALLFNTNAQGFVIAAVLTLLFAVRVRRFVPIDIAAFGAVVAWWQVRAPADPMRAGSRHVFEPIAIPWTIANAFTPTMPVIAGVVVGAAILIALTLVLRGEARLALCLPLLALLAIYSFVWIGGLRHAGFVLIVVLLAIWIAREVESPAAALLVNGALLISVFVGARAIVSDIQAPYSGAKEMARWMVGTSWFVVPTAAHNLTQCEAVLAYIDLPKTFWYAGLERDGSYMTWDAAFERALDTPYPVAEARARQHFAGRDQWLLLLNVEIPDPAAHGFRLLHKSPEPFEKTDEHYWLYAPIQ
jgi:hypothetical protein